MASPELEMVIELLRALPRGHATFAEERAALDELAGNAPLPDGIGCEPVTAGGVPAAWIDAPGVRRDAVMLYLHGGAYCIGSILSHRAHVARLAEACGLRALLLDYRLAPEHPFPAAVEDAVAAYRWLLERGTSPRRLVVAGDSAGGGLTLATLVALRDRGVPLPAAGVCISPWTDLALSGATMESRAAVDPLCQRATLGRAAAAYLGARDARTPLASPLYADLHGLPPLLIHVGDAETLLDDATRLAERARAAGVEVTSEVWDDMIHVFHVFAPLLPEATQALAKIGRFVRERVD